MPASLSDITFLCRGTPRQRAAWRTLQRLGILELLAPFRARLAGTIPIDVDIPGSDLDIICEAANLDALQQVLTTHFSHYPGFRCVHKTRYGHPILLCEFQTDDFPIQIYASSTPVDRQRAWVHMVAEAALLARGGEQAKAAVRALKRAGMKTEPAFAHVFGLAGDPYDVLYQIGLDLLTQHQDE